MKKMMIVMNCKPLQRNLRKNTYDELMGFFVCYLQLYPQESGHLGTSSGIPCLILETAVEYCTHSQNIARIEGLILILTVILLVFVHIQQITLYVNQSGST